MRSYLAILFLFSFAVPSLAQEKPKLAIRLESNQTDRGVRIAVSLENISDALVTLRDQAVPSFHVYPWVKASVDGKDAQLISHVAYALLGKSVERKIGPGERVKLGDVLVLPRNAHIDRSDLAVPVLQVEPGEREIRLALNTGPAAINKLQAKPASVKVNVPFLDAEPQAHVYKAVGELPIRADVYRLPGNDVRPALVWIHGGALITGHRGALRAEQRQRYLDAGFVVIAIDYRLAPETKLKGIIDDLEDAFRWLRDEGPKVCKIDPERIAVVGHSAGGYLTLMSGFAVKPRPRALVSFYGYGDITNEWYAKPDAFYRMRPLVWKEEAYQGIGTREVSEGKDPRRSKFYLYCRQNGLWPKEVAGHDPEKEPRAFDRFCPIRNVTKAYPPTLFLHGDKDTDVPHRQSVDMAGELKKHGVAHELVTIKDGPHGFDGKGLADPPTRDAFDRVLAFLKTHTAK